MNKKIIITFLIVFFITLVTTAYYLFFIQNEDLEKKLEKEETVELNKGLIGVQEDENEEIKKIHGVIENYTEGKLTLNVNDQIIDVAIVNSTNIYLLEPKSNFEHRLVSIHEYYYDLPDYPKILEKGVFVTVECENVREGELPRAKSIVIPKKDLSNL